MNPATAQRTQLLLNPKRLDDSVYADPRTAEIMRKTVEFFEGRGKRRLKDDDHAALWYQDFLDFVREERVFATLLTPESHAGDDSDKRWDTARLAQFAEILGFYGLPYWYTWQVSILGLGPIWMSDNEAVKQRTVELLEDGAIFAFGLSERAHGADVYSTDMILKRTPDGELLANYVLPLADAYEMNP